MNVEITEKDIDALLASQYVLIRSKQLKCDGRFIENIHNAENSRQIRFTEAYEVIERLLVRIFEEQISEYKQEATQMTQYDKIMQEMTPSKYAERLFTDHLKCYYCVYRGKIACHPAKPIICIDGIIKWLSREVKDNE